MQELVNVFGQFRRPFLGAVGVLVFMFALMSALANSKPTRAQAQAQAATAATPPPAYEYDVASIKPTKVGAGGVSTVSVDGFAVKGYTLKRLIQLAYGVPSNQVLGAPDWLSSEQYDVEAKADGAVAEALQKLNQHDRGFATEHMLQALLADRFKLRVHRETRELAVYSLLVAKNGPKFKEAKPDETPSLDTTPHGETRIFIAQAIPIGSLVRTLSSFLRSPVVDNTGLSGTYDFKLQWMPDETQSQGLPVDGSNGQFTPAPRDSSGPSLTSAVLEQLGLKLVAAKGPIGVIVIDHAERPSAN